MTKSIKPTKNFKNQYKKIRNNPKWKQIFTIGTMADPEKSPFEYIIECLIHSKGFKDYRSNQTWSGISIDI